MSVEQEIDAILTISPIQRGGEGKPVSLEDIAKHFNVPLSVVEDRNDNLNYYLHNIKVDLSPQEEAAVDKAMTETKTVDRGSFAEYVEESNIEPVEDSTPKKVRHHKYNPETKLQKAMEEIDEALIKKAKAGNVKAIEHFNKILGRITEKAEVKIGKLTGEDIFKRNLDAERDLKQMGYRVRRADGQNLEDVSVKCSLLPEGTRLDTEQEHGTEGEVGTVGVPE